MSRIPTRNGAKGKNPAPAPRRAAKGKVPGRQDVKKRRAKMPKKKIRPNLSAYTQSRRGNYIIELSSCSDSDSEIDDIGDQTL